MKKVGLFLSAVCLIFMASCGMASCGGNQQKNGQEGCCDKDKKECCDKERKGCCKEECKCTCEDCCCKKDKKECDGKGCKCACQDCCCKKGKKECGDMKRECNMTDEQKAEWKAFAEKWDNFDALTADEQKELIAKRKAFADEHRAKAKEMMEKMDQEWANFENLTVKEQKEFLDKMDHFRHPMHKGPGKDCPKGKPGKDCPMDKPEAAPEK